MKRLDHFERRLASVPLLRACSKHDLRRIASVADANDVREREVIVREGEQGHELFIIMNGEAVVSRNSRHVARLGRGDYFGELAVLQPAPRTATVTATTPMEILIVSSQNLAGLLADVPLLARKLLAGMAARLQDADTKVFVA